MIADVPVPTTAVVEEASPAAPSVIDAATLAAYPYVALRLADPDALTALWTHYRAAITPHVESVRRAGEIAAALIADRYVQEVNHLRVDVMVFGDVSPSAAALFAADKAKVFPTLHNSLRELSGSTSINSDVYLFGDTYHCIVDPILPQVTPAQFKRGHYAEMQLVNRCTVWFGEGEGRRAIHLVAKDVEGAWHALEFGNDTPIPLTATDLLTVELPAPTAALPETAPSAEAVEPVPSAAPSPDPAPDRYRPDHVALKLRNRLYGLRVGRIEQVTPVGERTFMVGFTHPIGKPVLDAIRPAFEMSSIGTFTLVIEVPALWTDPAQTQTPIPHEPLPEPLLTPSGALRHLDLFPDPLLTLEELNAINARAASPDEVRRLIVTVRGLSIVVRALFNDEPDARDLAAAMVKGLSAHGEVA